MQREKHRWASPALGQEMEIEIYGHAGRPVLAFPSQDGRMGDFAGFGMVEVCADFIENGRMRLVALDGIDWQSWTNHAIPPPERARRHIDYDRHVMDEVVPFVRKATGRDTMWVTGCSMGAFHASNFFFRRPDVFDGVIGLSGLYSARSFVDGAWDEAIYFNSPLEYLPGLADPAYLERYRRAKIAFAVGQGNWEHDCLADTRALEAILRDKGIPAWFDYWGLDVAHDWPWWRKMLPYFLDRLSV
ncbi:MAG: alpha/beta hydrolase-fold protein [Deltaproteobacteria bacterium]